MASRVASFPSSAWEREAKLCFAKRSFVTCVPKRSLGTRATAIRLASLKHRRRIAPLLLHRRLRCRGGLNVQRGLLLGRDRQRQPLSVRQLFGPVEELERPLGLAVVEELRAHEEH